jgi:predicted aspartyl protease
MKYVFLLLLLLSGCGAAGGGADTCAFVRETTIPVTFIGNAPTVLVKLNGQDVRLLFDTGASATVILPPAFKRLGLATDSTVHAFTTAVGGGGAVPVGLVSKMELGEVSKRSLNIFVVDMPPLAQGRIDGLLGNDILRDYDLDIDFAHNAVSLYRQRRCPQGGPDWMAAPFHELQRPPEGRALPPTMISLEVDGVRHNAVLDTGAAFTMMDRSRALASGANAAALAEDHQGKVQGATSASTNVAVHEFNSVTIGTETIPKPKFLVSGKEDQVGNTYYGMLLGADYIRKRRIWIAYSDFRIFAGVPAAGEAALK